MTISAGTKLGRYEIRSKIGAGGMGEVYLAEDTQLDRSVAVKILSLGIASDKQRSADGKWIVLSRGPEQRDVVLMSDFR